ncbi:mannosylglycerate hydrolase [Clostridium beijerinckii]|uniref:mannosylglycerate hydrolase n=1 Tax=Clostridium beijerinckii TaxID=1520 RepID=UPI001EED01DF|nr:mannosylglycerate hydrolase [Clostridium beijerinckii]
MKNKVHVVPHSHWDREWYFTTSRSKIYLMKDFKDVLDTLENNKNFKYFMIDAQASLLDDYLKWVPQDKERIKYLVKKGKLIIGPWYTQTDQLVISGESIVRNLYYGIERCKEFGDYMKVGYVPDSFGQSAQMPQIYSGFGIKDSLFWRGVSDDMIDSTEFNWKGSDGTVAFAVQIPFGYYCGGNIPEEEGDLKKYLNEQIGKLKEKASTNNVYLPNGFDQAPIRINLPEILEKANAIDKDNEYIISNIENYIARVKAERSDFKELEGEFVNGKHMRIHKSIFSSRSDLKMMNNHLENYIVNVVEPILTMSYSLGNEYPHTTMKDIWKLMFENAAHDSIGACNSDTTNEDVYMRYKQARDLSTNLLDLHMRLISTKIKNNNEEITLTLFNAYPKNRTEVIEFEVFIPEEDFIIKNKEGKELKYVIKSKEDITDYVLMQTIRLNPSKKIYMPDKVYRAKIALKAEDIPAVGYTQVVFELNKKNNLSVKAELGDTIENKYYKISANEDGSIDILDKSSNRLYSKQAVLEENGDDGDSYNYSPPRKDLIVSSLAFKSETKVLKSEIQEELIIRYCMKVPASLEERADGNASVAMPVEMKILLDNDKNIISFKVDIDNVALSHRVRVLFNTEIASKLSIADQQFGIISRKTVLEEDIKLWEENQDQWQEKPITIEPMQSFVTLENGERGLAVITEGVREYQIVGEKFDTIALTLFRSFGYMGRENLLYRPGRASGEKIVETPNAQLLGKLEFDFGVHIYNEEFDKAHIANVAKRFLTPIQVYEYADFLNGRMIFAFRDEEQIYENSYSLFEFENENFALSSIKKEENGTGLVIRIFNPMKSEATKGKITFRKKDKDAYYAMLDESYLEESKISIEDRIINPNPLSHCKVQTIVIK